MKLPHVDWEKMPWTKVREGVERKVFTGEGATLSLNRIWPGNTPKPHSHPHEQIVYIVDGGELDVHIGEDVYRLGAGSLMVIPPNVEHWGEVVGDKIVLNLDVFTPKREEYVS